MRNREEVVAERSPVVDDDVSIPYDAAARLAYDDWRRANNKKGAFNASKYAKFRVTYESITVANMAAKKAARESGMEPSLKELPSNADQ